MLNDYNYKKRVKMPNKALELLNNNFEDEFYKYAKSIEFKKGSSPFFADDLLHYFYIVMDGRIKTYQFDLDSNKELCESNFGLISRSFVLSDNIDRESIQAKFENGRLYLTLDKVESKKAKSISIN